jgi:hypothetical protein
MSEKIGLVNPQFIPRDISLPEKLIVAHLVKKLPSIVLNS